MRSVKPTFNVLNMRIRLMFRSYQHTLHDNTHNHITTVETSEIDLFIHLFFCFFASIYNLFIYFSS